jgi:hypothetical protein
VLPLIVSTAADAQTTNLNMVPGLSYGKAVQSRETWRTVTIVSGVLLFVGLVDDNSALILLGGAGLLVSLSATNGNMYRPQARGVELLQFGNVSFGVKPFGQMDLSRELTTPRPSMVLQAKFKF